MGNDQIPIRTSEGFVMKRCSACKLDKPLDAFSNNCAKKDGKQNQCKLCTDAYRASGSGKEKYRILRHRYYLKHKGEERDRKRTWRSTHRELYLEKERRRENKKVAALRDPYIRKLLRMKFHLPLNLIDLDLIEAKRDQLACTRIVRKINHVMREASL
jgi:hypothetical protein